VLYGWELLDAKEEDIIKRGVRDGQCYGGPFHLVLFPTDKCNLDCFFCYTEDLRKTAAQLDWQILEKALTEGVEMGVKGVSFGGGGESLVYSQLMPLLHFVEKHNLTIDSIKTNGTAITRKVAESLIRSNLQRICVSLNETTPETYAEMNRCSPRLFERAMAGIDEIVAARNRAAAKCEISVQIFVWRDNFRRTCEMIESLLKTGTDFVYVNTIDLLHAEKQMNPAEKEEFKEIIRSALAQWAPHLVLNLHAEGLGQFGANEQHKLAPERIELPDMIPGDERIEYCYIGWYAPVITASGHIYPCCHFATDLSRTLGSLHENSLRDIWYGDRAKKYRDEMRHLMLTNADPSLYPRGACFIHKLCMNRTDCAFNYYLASPGTYNDLHSWAESGPRRKYKMRKQAQTAALNVLRKGKRLVKKALP
jgi:radical SAM protein with 4Fe4S-binding SPASM domain